MTEDRDATLTDIAETLESENAGAVVVTDDDEPVGLVTDRDVARLQPLISGDGRDGYPSSPRPFPPLHS